MARKEPWEISDEFWAKIEPLIPSKEECRDPNGTYMRKSGGGRKRKYDDRTYFSAMVYVLRTRIIWNALPREKFGGLGSAALHRRFVLWERRGLFVRIWEAGLNKCDELAGITWNPLKRGKPWVRIPPRCVRGAESRAHSSFGK
ncbi:MAG: transposase [Planctomycetia bacterium]|nr:transposase [Planctomycetia bacterium]